MITQFGQEGIVYVGLKIIGVESRCSGACDFSFTIMSLCGGRGVQDTPGCLACETPTHFRSSLLSLRGSEGEKRRPEMRLRLAGYRLPGLNEILIRLIPHSLMDVLKLVSPN